MKLTRLEKVLYRLSSWRYRKIIKALSTSCTPDNLGKVKKMEKQEKIIREEERSL